MWRLARVPGIEAELLEKMSYDMVEGEYTSLGEAFHKDIGTYDGSLGRLARYEAILDRSLHRLLNQFRAIQADRIKREKRHAEDWARAGLPPLDPYADNDRLPSDYLEKIEATGTGEIAEDTTEDTTMAHSSPATGPRKRREPLERRVDHGGNGVNGTKARGQVRANHAAPPQPPSM